MKLTRELLKKIKDDSQVSACEHGATNLEPSELEVLIAHAEATIEQPTSVKRDWVKCPVCGEPDMRKEEHGTGNFIIQCVNHACFSNGGKNMAGIFTPAKFQSAPNREPSRAEMATHILAGLCALHGTNASASEAVKLTDELMEALSEKGGEEWEPDHNWTVKFQDKSDVRIVAKKVCQITETAVDADRMLIDFDEKITSVKKSKS